MRHLEASPRPVYSQVMKAIKGTTEDLMNKYVIEREIPQVGSLDRERLQAAAAKSNQVLSQLSPNIQWVQSYITPSKMFCIYLASDESVIRRHAELSGFPATKILEVSRVIDPTTAENKG
jgi:Protein of unknown function (DUF4242)